jgi:hypothetical protein
VAEKPKPSPAPKAPPETLEDEYPDWLQLPGIYCDTYLVDVWYSGVARLVFGEVTGRGGAITFRTSVVMPIADARELIKTLQESLDAYDAENAEKAK